jgi:hypothetical protein
MRLSPPFLLGPSVLLVAAGRTMSQSSRPNRVLMPLCLVAAAFPLFAQEVRAQDPPLEGDGRPVAVSRRCRRGARARHLNARATDSLLLVFQPRALSPRAVVGS